MRDHGGMGRRFGGRRSCLVAWLAPWLMSCAGPRALVPAAVTSARQPSSAATAGTPWKTTSPPTLQQVAVLISTKHGSEGIDEAGIRWWFPPPTHGGPAQTAAEVDTTGLQTRYFDEAAGLVGVTLDGRVVAATSAREPWVEVGQLPPGADPSTARFYRGGVTVRAGSITLAARDGRTFVPVAPPVGTTAEAVFLDRDGAGIGSFLPQLLATTRDGGATWSPLPEPGVRSALLEHRATSFVARYGRDARATAIAVELPTTKTNILSLSAPPETFHPSTPQLRAAALAWRGHPIGNGAPYPYDTPADGVAQGRIALAGDELVVFPDLWLSPSAPTARFTSLGRPVTLPTGSAFATGGQVSSALCRGLGAVVNGGVLRLFRADMEGPVSAAVGLRSAVGFDRNGALLTVSPPRAGAVTTLRRHDPTTGRTTSETPLPMVREASPRLVGGCGRPGLWLVTETTAMRLDDGGVGPMFPRPEDTEPTGVTHERALVFVGRGRLHFVPSGETVAAPVDDAAHLSLSEDGRHGLASAPSGQVFQTDDGGRSFSPIGTPPVLARQPVVCGATRCQLGAGLTRDGFARGEAPVSIWPDPAPIPARDDEGAPAGAPPTARPPAAHEAPSMRCVPEPSSFAALPGGHGETRPRLGDLLFTAGEDGRSVRGRRVTFFGDVAGRTTSAALTAKPPPPLLSPAFDRGPGLPSVALQPILWRPHTPVQWALEEHHDVEWRVSPLLVGRTGEGTFRFGSGELLLWGDRPSRSFASGSNEEWTGPGVFLEAPNDEILVASLLGVGEAVRLMRTRGDVIVEDRSFAIAPLDRAAPEELAIGLGRRESGAFVVLAERLDGGAYHLVRRDLGSDLTLGPPTAIAGTRAPRGELMALSSCALGSGHGDALVRTTSRHVRAALGGAGLRHGNFSRILQLHADGVCVERTVVAESPDSFRGETVVAGNGGIAVTVGDVRGARCSPVATHAVRERREEEASEWWLIPPPPARDRAR